MNYKISIIVPVFNEKERILESLKQLKNLELLNKIAQFIIVDDGSSDGTREILENSTFFQESNFFFVGLEKNYGKGYAIRQGLKKVEGEYTIIHDADLEYDPEDILRLLDHAEKNSQSILYGSRNLGSQSRGKWLFYWGGKLVTYITNFLFNQRLTDEATCYKLFKTDFLKSFNLTCCGFEFCPQVTGLACLSGQKIKEIPISYHPRNKAEGKKINYYDGLKAVLELLRVRFLFNIRGLSFLVFAFVFIIYFFTWPSFFMGYEEETARSALSLLAGKYEIRRAGIGATILYIPWAIVGKLLFSLEKQVISFLTLVPVFYSALTSGFIFLILAKFFKRNIAIITTLIISFGSLMWPYSKIGMEYQAMLLLTIIAYLLIIWKENKHSSKTLYVLGSAVFFLIITKSYGIVFALPVLIYIYLNLKTDKKKIFNVFYKIILLSGSAFLLNFGLNLIFLGKLTGAYSLAHEFQIWTWWEGFYGIFFSVGRSIFIYSSLLILSLFFWKKFFRERRDLAYFILVSFGLLLLITAPFSYWTDETLSVRKLVPIIPLLHLPLAYLISYFSDYKRVVKLFLIFFILVSFYVQFVNSLYPYWEQLSLLRNYKLNTLSVMRYSPQLSHLAINNSLFFSFVNQKLSNETTSFDFVERAWMNEGGMQEVLLDMKYDLSGMGEPKIFYYNTERASNRAAFLLIEFFSLSFLLILLYINWKNNRLIDSD